MSNDIIADTLTRIRNAQKTGKRSVSVRSSNVVRRVLDVLKGEGFISGFQPRKEDGARFETLEVVLKYYSNGDPVIGLARRVSKSGMRVYSPVKKFPRVLNGLGITVVSTSQGMMSDREAKKRKIGGEVVALIG